MPWYYHPATGQAKELDAALYAACVAAGNPKAAAYTPIADPPSPNAHYDGQQWITYEPTIEQRRAAMVCTPRQARRALLGAGLLDQVDAAIAAIADATERRQAEIDWEYATTVERLWPWVQTLGAALGLSAEDLDALFEQAATL